MITKVDTYKFGPFYFSSKYNKHRLQESLTRAKVLFSSVCNIPILPNAAAKIEEDLIRKSIFGTAAIEGNPLSQDEVNTVLSKEDSSKKIKQAEQQIINLKKAYEIIKNFEFELNKAFLPTEDTICKFHAIITQNSEIKSNTPGIYRNEKVKVGDSEHGGIYTPPKIYDDIKNLMTHFINWINSNHMLAEDEAIRAALVHYHFALIHPFRDGNGRTARAIEALLLKSAGIKFVPHMLSNFYYKNIDKYFWAFSLAEQDKTHDITHFLEFFLEGLISSLEELQNTIFGWIRKFTLREFYTQLRQSKEITQRQFDFLILLLEFPEQFSLKDLFEKEIFKVVYRNTSERTARRDLNLLQNKKLIVQSDKNIFNINDRVLG